MKVIEQSAYNFSKDNQPVEYADPGEVLVFKSMDCFSNQLKTEQDLVSGIDFSWEAANPAAGPLYVNGAEPGDVLVVDILDVQVASQGTIATMEDCGPLCSGQEIRTKKVEIRDGIADFNGVKFPVEPMIGVIGTAPEGEAVIAGSPGRHGGNMDSKLIKKGARVYFPVKAPGALLQMGDVHATMGDAEICGTGIEIPAEITVRVSLIKGFELNWPVTETETHWYVNVCSSSFEEAVTLASEELQRLLMDVTGWDKTDTAMYMSVQSDLGINQSCIPCDEIPMDLRFGTPKLPQFKPLIG